MINNSNLIEMIPHKDLEVMCYKILETQLQSTVNTWFIFGGLIGVVAGIALWELMKKKFPSVNIK